MSDGNGGNPEGQWTRSKRVEGEIRLDQTVLAVGNDPIPEEFFSLIKSMKKHYYVRRRYQIP